MMNLRDERPEDGAAIARVVAAAFGQDDEARLAAALRASGDAVISLVAEDGGEIVGHVLLSRMTAPFPALALAPVSVAPARQRSGVGSALVREAIARARDEGWGAIFVLGDPAYYRRFGFEAETAAGFSSPYAGEHFMALTLSAPPPLARGELRHAPAFAALDEAG
jgi:putative acetyltransferase